MAGEVCRASSRGPSHHPSDPEMAEGGGVGRRRVEGDKGRDAAGGSRIALAGEHLSALRLRSVGKPVAAEVGAGGHDGGPLRRRCRTGVRASEGRGSIPGATAGADAEVRAGTAPGENAVDRVWEVRGGQPEAERRGQTRDLRFSGLHAYLCENPEGQLVYGSTADDQKAAAGQTARDTAGASQAVA